MSNETITLVVAAWGAVLSTLLAVAKGVNWLSERRPRLVVYVNAPIKLKSTVSGDPHGGEFFSIHINNIGKPTTLGNIAFRYFKKRPIIFRFQKPYAAGVISFPEKLEKLPCRLEMGDQWSQVIRLTPILKEMSTNGFLYLQAVDSGTPSAHKFARARLLFDPDRRPAPIVGPEPNPRIDLSNS